MTLECFLNPAPMPSADAIISARFTQNGEPVRWHIRALCEQEHAALRSACQAGSRLDTALYQRRLVAACIQTPDLQDAALQKHHNVMGADALLLTILTPGEYGLLCRHVAHVNGLETTFEEDVDAAKK